MPVYDFACTLCKKKREIKLSFAEHTESKKNGIPCPECSEPMVQVVSPLNFKLKGWGWYASETTQGVDPYGLTDREVESNLELERRAEDTMKEMSEKGMMGSEE